MSQRCVIPDAFRFAGEHRSLQGRVGLASLSRLAASLASHEGEIEFRIDGRVDEQRRMLLELTASGVLGLQCQRCLTPMQWPFRIESTLWLVRPGEEIPEEELEDEDRDAVEVHPDMDVHALVEDEILLAVPIVPRHEVCEPPQPVGGTDKASPFAVLSALKK
jgi:uncharacterized protein